jgi:hypothetical protein
MTAPGKTKARSWHRKELTMQTFTEDNETHRSDVVKTASCILKKLHAMGPLCEYELVNLLAVDAAIVGQAVEDLMSTGKVKWGRDGGLATVALVQEAQP